MSGAGPPDAAAAWVRAVAIDWPNPELGRAAAKRPLPRAVAAPTSRRTCCPGVSPSVHTPGCACAGSLVKASTATPPGRATGATAAVSAAVSGPMMMPAPAASAALAAAAAPAGVPAVSRTSSAGEPGAASASWAAFTSAWPRSALGPVSGASSATLRPPGTGMAGGGSPARAAGSVGKAKDGRGGAALRPQAASAIVPARRTNARRNMRDSFI